jgi:hypothetical protein
LEKTIDGKNYPRQQVRIARKDRRRRNGAGVQGKMPFIESVRRHKNAETGFYER